MGLIALFEKVGGKSVHRCILRRHFPLDKIGEDLEGYLLSRTLKQGGGRIGFPALSWEPRAGQRALGAVFVEWGTATTLSDVAPW